MASEELTESEQKIKQAWVAGLILAVFNLIVAFAANTNIVKDTFKVQNAVIFGFALLMIAAMVTLLSLGILLKSRICAILLFVLFLVDRLMALQQALSSGGFPSGIIMSAFFLWTFAQGIAGTFAYHSERGKMGDTDTSTGGMIVVGGGLFVLIGFACTLFALSIFQPASLAKQFAFLNPDDSADVVDSPVKRSPEEDMSDDTATAGLPQDYVAKIKTLNTIERGESLKAIYTLPGGTPELAFYFYTDRDLGVFNRERVPPLLSFPLSSITRMELEANSGRSSKLVVMRREDPDSDREKKLNLILPSGEEENSKFYSGLEEEWKRKAPKKPAEKKTAAEK